jgi:hypothetical protein
MENTQKKCAFKGGCPKLPGFNFLGKSVLYCKEHKEDGMVSVSTRRACEFEDCPIRPSYNFFGEKRALYCYTHKKDGMVDIVNKLCEHKDCPKFPSFNLFGCKTALFCADHRTGNMVDIRAKRCKKKGCFNLPFFNIAGELEGLYCEDHVKDDMINVVNPRCKTENCGKRATMQQEYYCEGCFAKFKPGTPLPKYYLIKEHLVRTFLTDNFTRTKIVYNKSLKSGPSKFRPDILIKRKTHNIIVEVDENQHHNTRAYRGECDDSRSHTLFKELGELPLVMIRFNPDSYTDTSGVRIPSCFIRGKCVAIIRNDAAWASRLSTLKTEIERYMNTVSFEGLKMVHLYYNGYTN